MITFKQELVITYHSLTVEEVYNFSECYKEKIGIAPSLLPTGGFTYQSPPFTSAPYIPYPQNNCP